MIGMLVGLRNRLTIMNFEKADWIFATPGD